MKRIILVAAFFATFVGPAFAQQYGIRRSYDPQQMAEHQTKAMIEKLALSEAQVDKIEALNLKYALQIDSFRRAQTGHFASIRDDIREIRKAQADELRRYLTKEQFENWQAYQAERLENRAKRRKQRGKQKEQKQ